MAASEQLKADVRALFETGLSAMPIAEALGEPVSTVRNLICNMGLSRGLSGRGRPVTNAPAYDDLADQTDRADVLFARALARTAARERFADDEARTVAYGRLDRVATHLPGASAIAEAVE